VLQVDIAVLKRTLEFMEQRDLTERHTVILMPRPSTEWLEGNSQTQNAARQLIAA
jgi:hypothetical protein